MTRIRTPQRRTAGQSVSQPAAYDQIHQPILVIEDQRSLALMLMSMLQDRWGCEVHLAHSKKEAQHQLAEGVPYLVALCDLNLPDAEYGEIIDTINEAGIPAIAMTAAFGDELRESILKKGVVDYVLKDSINAYNYVCELVGRLAKNHLIKVLVVDDSLSIRALLKQSLEMYGLTVLLASNGMEGLATLQNNPDIRVMLVDYNMPEMDGFELTIEARKSFGKDRLAIIGISGSSDAMFSARFLKNGANDFIHKPFHFEEVICRVNQNLEVLELIEISQNAANRDYLTGLYNRRHFFHSGMKLFEASCKRGEIPAVAMLDIDHFKLVNDTYGHDCGDVVLKTFACELAEHFDEHNPARLGGEEFAVLLTGLEAQEICERFERFRERIANLKIVYLDSTLSITVSIGLSLEVGDNLDEILRHADNKLYQAKENGRNRVVV